VEKQNKKKPYMNAKYAKVILETYGKGCPKLGTTIVKALLNSCPAYPVWAEAVAQIDFRCDKKVALYECRDVVRKDFRVTDSGLVIK
jgi:hypothetical protein